MDRYTRAFVLASLVYLAAGGVMGALMWLLPETYTYFRFAHIHILLAGFMAMMIFGVGYFVLPRFAARTLQWPSLVAIHFWLANASLLAMVVSEPLSSFFASSFWPFLGGLGAILQAVSFLLFAGNLGTTLMKVPVAAGQREIPALERGTAARAPGRRLPVVDETASAAASLGPETPVAEVVDRKEGARELLIEAGLRPLQDPAHLEMIRARGVSLGHACTKHGIPMQALLSRLRALPDRRAHDATANIGPDQIIGDLVNRHPAAREVLLRCFGEGCFSCPGFSTETLAQGALMHGVKVEDLLADLQQTIARASVR